MDIAKINNAVNILLLYMVVSILIIGAFGTDIEADMVHFTLVYGVPLTIVALAVSIFLLKAIINRQGSENKRIKQILVPAAKLAFASAPMFFLNNTGASILTLLRQG